MKQLRSLRAVACAMIAVTSLTGVLVLQGAGAAYAHGWHHGHSDRRDDNGGNGHHNDPRYTWWETPVLATQAHTNVGIAELYETIVQHRQTLSETGQLIVRRRQHRRQELLSLLQQHLMDTLMAQLDQHETLLKLNDQVQEGLVDPYTAVEQILGRKDILLWR